MYRFKELWLRDKDCEEIVATVWGHTHGTIGHHVLATGANLQIWGENRFGNPSKRAHELKLKLKSLNEQVQTEAIILERKNTGCALHGLLKQEEVFWCQRSRASWLTHGDRNTSFFHRKASQRNSINTIESIEYDHGNRVVEEEDIVAVINGYFQNLFQATNPPPRTNDPSALVSGRITESHLLTLTSPYSHTEVFEALKCMHPTKAPGSDGTPTLF